MSRLTTNALQVAPPAAPGLEVTTGASEWLDGEWVPFFTATAEDTAIAGVCLNDTVGSGWSSTQLEVEFGIGTAIKTPIGHIRMHGPNSGNGGPTQYLLPYPISGIEGGLLVSVRLRAKESTPFTWAIAVLYYEDLDSDEHVPYTTALLTSYPAGTDSINLTPSETPWADSAWFEFEPIIGEASSVFGVAMANPNPGEVDAEIDIGTGAIGVELESTTVRFGAWGLNEGRLGFVNLPGLMPIAEGARLVGRLRKSSSETDPIAVAYLGYRGPIDVPVEGEGVIGPLLWIEWPERPQTV